MNLSRRILLLMPTMLCLVIFPQAGQAQEPVDLVLANSTERLRFVLEFSGPAPEARWSEFLKQWLAFYDRDGDGMLSREEAARVLALPLPSKSLAVFDFAKADANGDGKVSRAELETYYRIAGFKPVLTVVEPWTHEDGHVA